MLTVVSLSSVVNVLAQPERGLVLQEPADVAPPANTTTVPNATTTSLEDVNATSPVSVVNRSTTESTPEGGGPPVLLESDQPEQQQNVTELEPSTDNQTEPQKSSEIPENATDSEQSESK
jgi:hypothetical protein